MNNKKKINQEIKAIEILLKTYCICQPSIRFTFRVNSDIIFTKSSCKNVSEAFKAVIGVQKFSKLTHLQKCFSKVHVFHAPLTFIQQWLSISLCVYFRMHNG